uniref:Pre-SET domain-containing protein n=1 Tax=Denticeps clupeoides TaxID=299321 RepID=A0AAY4EXS0_9TELE
TVPVTTDCKSLWIRASDKCCKCKCKWPNVPSPAAFQQQILRNGEHAPLGRQSPLSVDSLDGLSPLSPPQCESFDLVMLSPAFGDPPTPPSEPCFEPHDCSSACVPHLPPHADHFLGQNPLQVALLCRFQRHSEGLEVLYKGPCGRSLSSMEAVLRYLLKTESLGVLHPGNFSFSPVVQPTRAPPAASPRRRDLSQGAEPVPVQLCNELDAANPPQFRYRKDRWPHGCYLSRGPLFTDCCDCTDGCGDARACACLRLSLRAAAGTELYRHQRLQRPVPTGLYECSPWCGCDRSRCLNRVVQRGLRVRLQVFRTEDRGWGVRCQDDLDSGTFVCTYAGENVECIVLTGTVPPPPETLSVNYFDQGHNGSKWVWIGGECVTPLGYYNPRLCSSACSAVQRPAVPESWWPSMCLHLPSQVWFSIQAEAAMSPSHQSGHETRQCRTMKWRWWMSGLFQRAG